MIKFFRNTRKKLALEKPSINGNSKYLKYAIGEIVLVVVGILIALSINNLNENRKEKVKEMAILRQLHTEFKSNLVQLDKKIEIRIRMMSSSRVLLNYIDNPKLRNLDSINLHLLITTAFASFDPIINDLASSGNLRLLSNNNLKQILSYWTSDVVQLREVEDIYKDYSNKQYIPFLMKNYPIRSLISTSFRTEDYNKQLDEKAVKKTSEVGKTKYDIDFNILLDSRLFENYLSRIISMNNYQNLESWALRKRIVTILAILDTEIKQ